MPSIAERIAQAVYDALLVEPQIPEVLGRVERAREDTISRDEIVDGQINVRSGDENSRRHSEEHDDNELDISVEINVRAAPADNVHDAPAEVWETAADTIAVAVHRRIKTYAYPGLAIAVIMKRGRSPNGEEGDYTPGQLTLTYTFRYLTMADDISAQP